MAKVVQSQDLTTESSRGDGKHLVGAIDIGATKALLAVRQLPLDGWRVDAPALRIASLRDPEAFADELADGLRALAHSQGGLLVAVGVGTPGPLDRATGVIVHSPNQGWRHVPLGPMLAKRLGVPVVLEDDANSGGLGETIFGAGRGADPCVYVALGTGLGTGVVVGGAVLHGAHDAAGEMGHLVVDPAGPRCDCGHRGCVEAYAAGAGIEHRGRRAWPRRRTAAGAIVPRDAADIFRAARAYDPDATRIVDEATEALARCFGAIAAAIDPAVIVVGGSVGLGQRDYVQRAAKRARRYSSAESGSRLRVVSAALGEQSVLAGAAHVGCRLALATH